MKKKLFALKLLLMFVCNLGCAKDTEKTPLIPKKEAKKDVSNAQLWLKLRSDNPNVIGAIAESSKTLAKAITNYVFFPKYSSTHVLEVGAGRGVFTRELASKLGPNDHLDIVELTKELCQLLENEFGNNKSITIYCGDILEWKPGANTYDYIISGLPFNSFPSQLVIDIIDHYVLLSKPNSYVSFFEYVFLPKIKPYLLKKEDELDYEVTRTAIHNFVNKYQFDETKIYKNIPPAVVHHLKINK